MKGAVQLLEIFVTAALVGFSLWVVFSATEAGW